MRAVLFTKLFGERPVEQVAGIAADLGFDGIDLLIREGFPATPDDPTSIVDWARHLAGTATPVLTVTTDMTDPGRYPVDAVLGACADAGIPTVRVGYWYYDGSVPYADLWEQARRNLDELATLAAKHGVTLLLQLHGGTIHSSGALARNLLAELDPAAIGTYIDPGNQAVQDGREDWRLTFDLLGDTLRCVGVKNGGWSARDVAESGQRRWASDWLGVADGMVPWDDVVAHLRAVDYDGVLSFHGHYELPFEQVVDQTRTDLGFIRRLVEASH